MQVWFQGLRVYVCGLSWRTLNPKPWGRQVWVEVLPTTDLDTQSSHVCLNLAFMGGG